MKIYVAIVIALVTNNFVQGTFFKRPKKKQNALDNALKFFDALGTFMRYAPDFYEVIPKVTDSFMQGRKKFKHIRHKYQHLLHEDDFHDNDVDYDTGAHDVAVLVEHGHRKRPHKGGHKKQSVIVKGHGNHHYNKLYHGQNNLYDFHPYDGHNYDTYGSHYPYNKYGLVAPAYYHETFGFNHNDDDIDNGLGHNGLGHNGFGHNGFGDHLDYY